MTAISATAPRSGQTTTPTGLTTLIGYPGQGGQGGRPTTGFTKPDPPINLTSQGTRERRALTAYVEWSSQTASNQFILFTK
jgi:hypothetical protein